MFAHLHSVHGLCRSHPYSLSKNQTGGLGLVFRGYRTDPTVQRLRREDQEFKARMCATARLCQ